MEHIGIEKDRLHFSWVSSAESTKFITVVNQVVSSVKSLGPNERFIKNKIKAV